MSDLVVFRKDIVDKGIGRGMIGIKEGSDRCLDRIRMIASGATVCVFPGETFFLNGDRSLKPITKALNAYLDVSHPAKTNGAVPPSGNKEQTWRNAVDSCRQLLSGVHEHLNGHTRTATVRTELDGALELIGYYRSHRSWYRNGEHYFLLHVGKAVLGIRGI